MSVTRELSDEAISDQAQQLLTYIQKPGNRGASAWLDSKDFASGDRVAILLALGDDEPASGRQKATA